MAAGRLRRTLLSVAVTTASLVVLSPHPALADPTYTFAPSGLDSGGSSNAVVYSPFLDPSGARPLLLASDIAGIQRSVDDGRTWAPANGGMATPADGSTYVATLLFSDTVPGKVYAGTGSALMVSTDFGQHWTARPAPVDFDGNGAYKLPGTGQSHPRSTGHLLALAHTGTTDFLYAATATQGVKRSSDDGATWEAVALAGNHLRSLALDPADPDHLFVGSVENGLQETTDASTGFDFARVPGGPTIPEELAFIGPALYVAGGVDGIFRYDGAWQALNTGLPAGPAWESVTGSYDAGSGQTVLYIGCAQPVNGASAMKSADGGATWTSLTSGTGVTIHPEEYGQTTPWWAANNGYLRIDGANAVTTDIAVDPDDPRKVVLANRVGASVGIQGASGIDWWPAVRGQMTTASISVVADPKLPGRVYVGAGDFTFFASPDDGRTFRGAGPTGAPTMGDEVALDPDGTPGRPSTVYLAASRKGENTGVGRIYSNPDPVGTPTAWTNESLPVSNDVRALGVGHSAGGSRVILAAVTGNGLYRKDGGTWARVTGTAPFSTATYGSFAWVPGTPTVYAVDANGLWRSAAAGATGSWVKLSAAAGRYQNVDNLALDPRHPGVLYVSDTVLGGIARVDGADTTSPVTTLLLPLASPGAIELTPDGALLAQNGGSLLRAADPAGDAPVFVDVADSFFRDNDSISRGLAVGPDGYVYTASNRAGVSVSPPLDVPPPPLDTTPPSAPADLTSPSQTLTSVSLTWSPSTDDVGVAGYQVSRDGTVVGWVPQDSTSAFTDSGLSPATTHDYAVVAVDTSGNPSDPSGTITVSTPADTTPPTGPSTLNARVVSPTQVALTWPAATDDVGVVGYQVFRDNTLLLTVPGRSWTDTNAPAGAAHTYGVRAVDAATNQSSTALASVTLPAQAPHGLTGTYFDTATLTTPKLTRVDSTVNFAWGTGSPATVIAPDTFSARWTGQVIVPAAGSWTFVTQSDNGVRLYVDGVRVINNWTSHPLTTNKVTVALTADRAHVVQLEYFEQTGSATMKLLWSGPGQTQQVIPAAQLLAR